jgi:Mn2+/Fe2+ NRAMP family transporter
MLFAAYKRSVVGEYKQPAWLSAAGIVAAIAMATMGGYTVVQELPKLVR